MYIDDTINFVNTQYVNKNKTLLSEFRSNKLEINDEDYYEFDEDGDLMSLIYD
jgi:hypothetical protein